MSGAEAARATVRAARLDDLRGIQEVGLLTWPATYLPFTSPEYVLSNLSAWWTQDAVRSSIEHGTTLVAELDGRIVGTASIGPLGEETVLWKLYVIPERQGQGVASALLREILRAVPSGRDLLVEFIEGNEQARRFYERQGFRPERTEAGELGTTVVWYRRPAG